MVYATSINLYEKEIVIIYITSLMYKKEIENL